MLPVIPITSGSNRRRQAAPPPGARKRVRHPHDRDVAELVERLAGLRLPGDEQRGGPGLPRPGRRNRWPSVRSPGSATNRLPGLTSARVDGPAADRPATARRTGPRRSRRRGPAGVSCGRA